MVAWAGFAGAGAFAGNAQVGTATTWGAAANFNGTGNFTAVPEPEQEVIQASFAGAGSFTASAAPIGVFWHAAAGFAGAGSFSANAQLFGVRVQAAAGFAGTGGFTATATLITTIKPLATPNGRWCPVFDASARLVYQSFAFAPLLVPNYSEVGFTLYFCSPAAGNLRPTDVLVLTGPNGAEIVIPQTNFYTGKDLPQEGPYAAYVTTTGDLNQLGPWTMQLKRTAADAIGFSGLGLFTVAV
jgi:hypothetical protein